MAGIITTANFGWDLMPLGAESFGLEFDRYTKDIYTRIFNVMKTNERYHIDYVKVGMGFAQLKPEGQGVASDTMAQSWNQKYEQAVYGTSFMITREMEEDGHLLNVVKEGSEEVARRCIDTQALLCTTVLNGGFATLNGGDGVTIFNTAHPIAIPNPSYSAGQNYSNCLGTPSAVSEAALETAFITGAECVDERGNPIILNYDEALIHPASMFQWDRILRGALRVQTADNDINALKYQGRLPGNPVLTPYFSNTNTWVLKDSRIKKGPVVYQKRAPEYGKDSVFSTQSSMVMTTFRSATYVSELRSLFGSY